PALVVSDAGDEADLPHTIEVKAKQRPAIELEVEVTVDHVQVAGVLIDNDPNRKVDLAVRGIEAFSRWYARGKRWQHRADAGDEFSLRKFHAEARPTATDETPRRK